MVAWFWCISHYIVIKNNYLRLKNPGKLSVVLCLWHMDHSDVDEQAVTESVNSAQTALIMT